MPPPDKSSPPRRGESTHIAELIRQLAQSDPTIRMQAAAEIFAEGVMRAEPIVRAWLADADVAACFVIEAALMPQTTVGIATFPETFARIRTANASPDLAHVPPDIDAEEFELRLGAVRLDVLTTRDPDGTGAIAKFLKKHGEEIQQIEWNVRNVERATALVREKIGITPVYPQARIGANQTRVNFFLVHAAGSNLLIELVEISSK